MNTQLILLIQSATSAMVEIGLLLLGVALIGFFTAWIYQKSVFTPIIKQLESEKVDLNKKIDVLNNDLSKLKGKISELEKIITERDKEIVQLKKPQK